MTIHSSGTQKHPFLFYSVHEISPVKHNTKDEKLIFSDQEFDNDEELKEYMLIKNMKLNLKESQIKYFDH